MPGAAQVRAPREAFSKRLLLLTTDIAYGGAQRQLLLMAREFVARGWETKLVTLLRPKAFEQEALGLGVHLESLNLAGSLRSVASVARLVRIIKEWHPDVMHCHMVHANLVGRAIRPLTKVPVLVSAARNEKEGGRWREYAYRLTDRWSDVTVQNSKAGAERYVKIRAVPSTKIRFVPNGVDTEHFVENPQRRDLTRERLGVNEEFLWLAVGRVAQQKDYPTMLRAFRQMQQAIGRTTRLLIVGTGTTELQVSAVGGGDEPRIDVLEPTPDVVSYMNAADAFVMSSRWEGMPNVLLEAASCGLPIVSTKVGSVAEIVRHGETGVLVGAGESDALGEAMTRISSMESDKRAEMGARARALVKQQYDIGVISQKWLDLYSTLSAAKEAG